MGGAALDVLEGEEGIFYTNCRNKAIESKLLLRLQELPNVLVSPHTAFYTDHALSLDPPMNAGMVAPRR